MQALIIEQSKFVFAKITGTPAIGQVYSFDINSAQDISAANIKVYAIEAITAAEQAKDQLGNTVVAAAGAPSLVYNIKDTNGKLLMENYSFQRSRVSQNSGFPIYLNDFKIDLTKSNITLVAATSLNANEVAGFIMYYKKF